MKRSRHRLVTAGGRPFYFRGRGGFTMIELLAATAIAAAVMIAVLRVVATLDKTTRVERELAAAPGLGPVADAVRFDAVNGRGWIVREGAVELIGHCGLNPATLEPDHAPSRVLYRLATPEGGETSWLVREQRDLAADPKRPTPPLVSWLLPGVQAFELTAAPPPPRPPEGEEVGAAREEPRAAPPAGAREAATEAERDRVPEVPEALVLRVRFAGSNEEAWLEETILVH